MVTVGSMPVCVCVWQCVWTCVCLSICVAMSVCICVYILVCVSLWECCKGVWVCVCVERQSLRWKRLEHIPKLRRRSGGERVSKKRVLLTLRTLLEFRWFSNWIFLSSTHSDCVYHLPNYCPYLSCSRPSSFICSFTGMKVKVLVTQSCLTLTPQGL